MQKVSKFKYNKVDNSHCVLVEDEVEHEGAVYEKKANAGDDQGGEEVFEHIFSVVRF